MSSYDQVMAASRRQAQREAQQRRACAEEARAERLSQSGPPGDVPRESPVRKTRGLFEWDAFDVFCCAPQHQGLSVYDPVAEPGGVGEEHVTPVLLDVEIDRDGGGLGGGSGSVRTISFEASPDVLPDGDGLDWARPPTCPGAVDGTPTSASRGRLSGSWDDDSGRVGHRNLELVIEIDADRGGLGASGASEAAAADPWNAAGAPPGTPPRGAGGAAGAGPVGPVTPPSGDARTQAVDISTPIPAASRDSERATFFAPPGKGPSESGSALLADLAAVAGDFKRNRKLARHCKRGLELRCADLSAIVDVFDLESNKIKGLVKCHAFLDDPAAFEATLAALLDSDFSRDRVRADLGLPLARRSP